MKLTMINPAKLFKSEKSPRSVSRSETDPSSSSSHTSSSSYSAYSSEYVTLKKPTGSSTPTTVLPTSSITSNVHFDLKQAFEMIDRDGDGKVKQEELESLLIRIGAERMSPEELKSMLSDVDRDGDGCISLEEFSGAIGSYFAPPSCDSELREAFEFFDSDRNGKITAEELYGVFETIGDQRCTLEDCRRMISCVDRNGDGFVCFEDFTRMMVNQQ